MTPSDKTFAPDELHCETVPALRRVWSASSLDAFMRCPRYFQLSTEQGWRRVGGSEARDFGTMVHACCEAYEWARGQTPDGVDPGVHEHALRVAVQKALEVTGKYVKGLWCPGFCNGWAEATSEVDGEDLCQDCGAICEKREEFVPHEGHDNKRTRETLIRLIVWHLDAEHAGPAETMWSAPGHEGEPAVELTFAWDLPRNCPDGTPYVLRGTFDRLITIGDEIAVDDRKTTASFLSGYFFRRFKPATQPLTYDLVTHRLEPYKSMGMTGVRIEAVQTGVTFARSMSELVRHNPDLLDEFERDILATLEEAELCAERGYWPKRTSACTLYGGCEFRGICSMSPSQRGKFIKSDFRQEKRK